MSISDERQVYQELRISRLKGAAEGLVFILLLAGFFFCTVLIAVGSIEAAVECAQPVDLQ